MRSPFSDGRSKSPTGTRRVTVVLRQRSTAFPREHFQETLILPRKLRQQSKVLHDAALKRPFQKRQQFPSYPRSHPRCILIRSVLPPLLFLRSQILPQLRSPHAEQWPHNAFRLRMNPAQARQSGPAQDMRQHRLCLVIRRMRHRHAIHFSFLHKPRKKLVPRPPARILQVRLLAFSARRHVHALAVKLQSMLSGQRRTNFSSASAAFPRSLWFKCATLTTIPSKSRNSSRSKSNATESAPPDTPTPTRSPARNISRFLSDLRKRPAKLERMAAGIERRSCPLC